MEETLLKEATEKCEALGLTLRHSRLYEIYIVEICKLNEIKKSMGGFNTLEGVIEFCENRKQND